MKRLFDILKKIVYFPLVDKLVSLGGGKMALCRVSSSFPKEKTSY